MFKNLASAAGLAAAFALSTPVAAQSFDPAPTSVEFSGPVTLTSGGSVDCMMRMTVDITSAGDAVVSNPRFDPGDLLCGFAVPFGTWTLEAGPGLNQATLAFGFTLGPSCYGSVTVPFSGGSTATIDLSAVTLSSSPPCAVDGVIESDGPLGIL